MADRTSASVFALIFTIVDNYVTEPKMRREISLELWKAQRSYDFSPYQMGCDDVLKHLGLARDGVDKCGPTVLYGPEGE